MLVKMLINDLNSNKSNVNLKYIGSLQNHFLRYNFSKNIG